MPELDRLADSIAEACRRLSISRSAIYREISAGRLRAIKMRGRTLIARADQAAWLNNLPEMPTRA